MKLIWPDTTRLDESGELWVGGCNAQALAAKLGTPLYVYDERTLREGAQTYRTALAHHYAGPAQVAYAAKAYLCLALAQLWEEEGLDLDVVSGGELHVALRAGFPAERIHFHGNNKSPQELRQALASGVGRIVVDNFHELSMLCDQLSEVGDQRSAVNGQPSAVSPQPIWLRLAPGIQAHTHAHIQTGQEDTKFGFSIASGDAERAVVQALAAPGLALVGLHAHIGSQIYEPEALAAAAQKLVAFAAQMRDRHGFVLRELSPGGGWGVPMVEEDPAAPIEAYIAALSVAVTDACRVHGLDLPRLVVEPGRSLVARAGVALYRAGARKEIPGVRTYVAVDGGMADNIRPALYGAKYAALGIRDRGFANPQSLIPNPQSLIPDPQLEVVTIAGRYCESGDILIRDIALPHLEPGDLVAIPMAGAYTLAMASNYNLTPRPAAVLVRDGQAQLIQRRETYDDLLWRDLPLHGKKQSTAMPYAVRNTQYVPRFWKYQALGNDYIVLDPADWPATPTPEQIRRICDRHRGVGADGVLWGPLPDAPTTEHTGRPTFALRLFNPDGSEFEKSGNGLRIFARYLWDRSYVSAADFALLCPGGLVVTHVLDGQAERISLEMGVLSFDSQVIGLHGPQREVIGEPAAVRGREVRIIAASIGNPHCVVFVGEQTFEEFGDLKDIAHPGDLEGLARALGPELERLPLFPQRTNVQFARVVDKHTLRIAIWERGAGYTLASGTSACAAAGAAIRTGRCVSPVTVQMPGGQMLVEVAEDWTVRLTGTVGFVCEGVIGDHVLS